MGTRPRGTNPYAAPTEITDGGAPPANNDLWSGHARYAIRQLPESSDPEYTDAFSPRLLPGGSPNGTALPDDIRMGYREPTPSDFNDPRVNAVRTRDFHNRMSVERQELGHWQERQERLPRPVVPEWTQERLPRRPTESMAPLAGGQMQRPWHIPRNRAEIEPGAVLHFSMAEYRRNYPIMGMAPQGRLGVNTYRKDPRPWDEGLFPHQPPASDSGVPNSLAGNRAYRKRGVF